MTVGPLYTTTTKTRQGSTQRHNNTTAPRHHSITASRQRGNAAIPRNTETPKQGNTVLLPVPVAVAVTVDLLPAVAVQSPFLSNAV